MYELKSEVNENHLYFASSQNPKIICRIVTTVDSNREYALCMITSLLLHFRKYFTEARLGGEILDSDARSISIIIKEKKRRVQMFFSQVVMFFFLLFFLRPSKSILFTSSMLWNGDCQTIVEFYNKCVGVPFHLLPTILGLKLAVDLELGSRLCI